MKANTLNRFSGSLAFGDKISEDEVFSKILTMYDWSTNLTSMINHPNMAFLKKRYDILMDAMDAIEICTEFIIEKYLFTLRCAPDLTLNEKEDIKRNFCDKITQLEEILVLCAMKIKSSELVTI